jgi:hypothetical protein
MQKRKITLSAVAAFCASFGSIVAPSVAQSLSTQAGMHARVVALYSFSPSKVTDEVRESKSKEMDAFWDEVKAHKDEDLPLLRRELENPENPKFFFADGSGLLLSLSQTPEDQKIAVRCLAKIDLSDFQSRQFLYEVHGLAVKGVDVTPAALHLLDDPKFVVFLPEHGAYKLDQAACLYYSLLPLPNDVWLPSVIGRLKTERDETAIKSMLLLLFYAQTDDADRMLRSVSKDPGASKTVRDFAEMILKHERDLGVGKNPSRALEIKFREQRRLRMAAVSDEAVDDMEDLTTKIAQSRSATSLAH